MRWEGTSLNPAAMALPTRNQVKTQIVAWWQAPGKPRLARLRAALTPLVTPPHSTRGAVIVRISDPGEFTNPSLVVALVTWDALGVQTVAGQYVYDVTDFPGSPVADFLDDIVDDSSGKRTRRERAAESG